jgi:hypothetical protein
MLSSVKVDGTALTQQQMNLGSYTFTNVTAAHTIDVKSVPHYITATADSNSVVSPSGTVAVPNGTNQTFTFSAKSGYSLSSVKVDGTALTQQQMNLGSYTFTNVTAAHTIDVKSIAHRYITATADSNSVISPSGAVGVPNGSNQTFAFSAKSGYSLSSVKVDGTALTQQQMNLGSYTFANVTAAHTIDVVSVAAAPREFIITATADSNSVISPSGKISVLKDNHRTFTFSAKAGYYVSEVIVDGAALTPEQVALGKYTFYYVYYHHSISVKSLPTPYHISAKADANSMIFPSGTIGMLKGASELFTFSAKSGYVVFSVKVNGADIPREQRILGYYIFDNVQASHRIEITSLPKDKITVLEMGGIHKEGNLNIHSPTSLYIPSGVIKDVKWDLVNKVPLTDKQGNMKYGFIDASGAILEAATFEFLGVGGFVPMLLFGVNDSIFSLIMWNECNSADRGLGVILHVWVSNDGIISFNTQWKVEAL